MTFSRTLAITTLTLAGCWFAAAASGQPCAPGTFSGDGMEPCALCAAGTFQPGSGATECLLCPPGTFNPLEGAAECSDCPDGSTSDAGATACEPILSCSAGGSAECLDLTRVTCYNRSTRRRASFTPSGPDWDCVEEGLAVSPGDRVIQYVYGTVGCAPVGGAACGVTPTYLQCLNLDNGTRGNPAPAGSWDCEAAGMVAADGQRVRMTVDGEVDASAPASCLEILDAGGSTGDGVYGIDPDGSGPIEPFDAYCDMTFDGGGWTLIESTDSISPEALPAGLVAPFSGTYMPTATMTALAAISTQVHIRSTGDAGESVTSAPESSPIVNLRLGLISNDASNTPVGDISAWSGPFTGFLDYDCAPHAADGFGPAYPQIYQACGNIGGLHIWLVSKWDWCSGGCGDPAGNIPLDTFLR